MGFGGEWVSVACLSLLSMLDALFLDCPGGISPIDIMFLLVFLAQLLSIRG